MAKSAGVKAFEDVGDKINDFLNSDVGQKALDGLIKGFELVAFVGGAAVDLLIAGATLVTENWDYVQPILAGIAVALAFAGAAGVMSGLATVAAWGPVAWTAIAIGAGIAALTLALNQAGVSWQQMGTVAGTVLGGLYSFVYTVVAYWWNLFASFAEFFANVFDNPAAAVAHLFHDLFDNILQVVETVANAIDTLTGSNLAGAVSGFRGKLSGWVDSTFGENAVEIKRMSGLDIPATLEQFGDWGGALGSKIDGLGDAAGKLDELLGAGGGSEFDPGAYTGGGGLGDVGDVGSVGRVKKIDDDISLSDEDIKLYRDLAERRYMNKVELKTLAPNINVSIPEDAARNLSADDVANRIKAMLIQEMNSGTDVPHVA